MAVIDTSPYQIGHPVLRKKAKAVKFPFDLKTLKTVRDLRDSMRKFGLVGMAAPQIGVSLRVFVTELRETKFRNVAETDPLRVFINPKIIKKSSKTEDGHEGCGSVGQGIIFAPVKRHFSLTVEAYDAKGKKFTLEASGLLARVIQHEVDHLEGILFAYRVKDNTSFVHRKILKEKLVPER